MEAQRVRRNSSVQGNALEDALSALSDARLRSDPCTQLAHCRALAGQWEAGALSPVAIRKVPQIVLHWISVGSATGSTAGSSVPGQEGLLLQREALRLLQQLAKDGRAQLQQQEARQLLKVLQTICTGGGPVASDTQLDLICHCADVLGLLPQLATPDGRREALAGATSVSVLALGVLTRGQGPLESGLVYVRLLKALQALLAEAKKDHNCNVSALIPALQRLLAYGLHQPPGTLRQSPWLGCPAPGLQPPQAYPGSSSSEPGASQAEQPGEAQGQVLDARAASRPASNSCTWRSEVYVPPHLRQSSLNAPGQGQAGPQLQPPSSRPSSAPPSSPPKLPPPLRPGIGPAAQATRRRSERHTLDSSDSEVSDSEGGRAGDVPATRVRLGVLAVLQVLAKSDPKAVQPAWVELFPASDTVLTARCVPLSGATLAHTLLHDPSPRVRQAAAVTISTLLEGPAQRAYLGVAECGALGRQPVRGFITLSMSLGLVALALHAALLHCLRAESDPGVLLGALRALGTLLLAAPYHRLPPQLLLGCVQGLHHSLQQAVAWGSPRSYPRLTAPLPTDAATLVAACLTCLAAAFSTKQPSPELADFFAPESGRSGDRGGGMSLMQLLFGCAACGSAGVELEAVLALRGLAQQYRGAVAGEWGRVLGISQAAMAAAAQAAPLSPRAQQDGSLQEKLAHQSIRLVGDCLAVADPFWPGVESRFGGDTASFSLPPSRQRSAALPLAAAAEAAAAGERRGLQPQRAQQHAQQWQATAQGLLRDAISHSSPLVRSAVHAAIAGLSPGAFAALPSTLQRQLLEWCCAGVAKDQSSPVRAVAARAVGALAGSTCCMDLREGLGMLLQALQAGCQDQVLAVRVPAAASLAALCHMLSDWLSPGRLADGTTTQPWAGLASATEQPSQPASTTDQPGRAVPGSSTRALSCEAAVWVLPALLDLATRTAEDSEKVRASGVEALGHAFACLGHLSSGSTSRGAGLVLDAAAVKAAAAALVDSLQCSVPRVQWSACSSAGLLLRCCSQALGNIDALGTAGEDSSISRPATAGQLGWVASLRKQGHVVLDQLLTLLGSCPSMRSRVRAAQALRGLQSVAWYHGSLGELLRPVCEALFEGKACGFRLPESQAGHSVEPADSSVKSQLEEELVVLLLHLLSLLAPPSPPAGEQHSSRPHTPCDSAVLLQQTVAEAARVSLGGEVGLLQAHWPQLCRLVQAGLMQANSAEQAAVYTRCNEHPAFEHEFPICVEALRLSTTAAAGIMYVAGVTCTMPGGGMPN